MASGRGRRSGRLVPRDRVQVAACCSRWQPGFPWGLGEPIAEDAKRAASELARELEGFPLTFVLARIDEVLGQGIEYAQGAFWQSVWSRALP